MKSYIIRLLRRLLAWLEEDNELLSRAKELVTAVDRIEAVSGEYKRHQVYASLLKEFPGRRKRDIGLAIEKAL